MQFDWIICTDYCFYCFYSIVSESQKENNAPPASPSEAGHFFPQQPLVHPQGQQNPSTSKPSIFHNLPSLLASSNTTPSSLYSPSLPPGILTPSPSPLTKSLGKGSSTTLTAPFLPFPGPFPSFPPGVNFPLPLSMAPSLPHPTPSPMTQFSKLHSQFMPMTPPSFLKTPNADSPIPYMPTPDLLYGRASVSPQGSLSPLSSLTPKPLKVSPPLMFPSPTPLPSPQPVEVVNGGYGIKNPMLANNRFARDVSVQELGELAWQFLIITKMKRVRYLLGYNMEKWDNNNIIIIISYLF